MGGSCLANGLEDGTAQLCQIIRLAEELDGGRHSDAAIEFARIPGRNDDRHLLEAGLQRAWTN